MKEELIKAIEDKRLVDYIIDHYGDMPMKTVKKLMILLAVRFRHERSEDLIDDIVEFYKEDFE